MAPFESTDHGFISSSDDIEEGTTNQFFTQARAQASFQVSNRPINLLGDQVFDGVTYLFGGLNLTNGTITYIPPTPVNLSPYAPLVSPAFTGTPTVGGTAIKVNVGDGALTEKNFTTALKNKLDGIAPVPSNLVETYINRKTLSGTGATDFFTINRDIQRSFVIDLRIVAGDGINECTLYHTRSGIVFTASEIFIRPTTDIIANTSFSGGGSAYTTSLIEAPSNVQLDIRVNSATGGTQTVAAYMTLYGTRTNPTVVIT